MKKEESFKEFDDLFSPEEIEAMELTDDELELMRKAVAVTETTKMLPKDPDSFVKKIEDVFGDLSEEEIKKKTEELVKTDPEFIKQIVTVYSINELVPAGTEESSETKVEKVTLDEIKKLNSEVKKEEDDEMVKSIIDALKSVD